MKKKILVLSVFFLFTSFIAAENNAATASPDAVTQTAIPAQVTASASTALGTDAAASGSIGLSGFTFRFLNADKTGYEIPFSITYASWHDDEDNESYSFSLASGIRLVRPIFIKSFIRVNTLLGFTLSYTGSWYSNVNNYGYPGYSSSTDTFFLNPQFGIEVEVPVGGVLSLPPDTICITSTLILTGSAGYKVNYSDSKFNSSSVNFQLNSQSTGTNLLGVGLRYYF
jgi:hypothetical protein